ncbi:MAG: hypothetical protein VKQ33_13200 [Candidatus Sericytochromatia bacterium]|nr:hypothetical protein [Candidatus Sericytochromatia bacterium]
MEYVILFVAAYAFGWATGPRIVAWGQRKLEQLFLELGCLVLVLFPIAPVAVACVGALAAYLGLIALVTLAVEAALETEVGRQLPQAWRTGLAWGAFLAAPVILLVYAGWTELQERWPRRRGEAVCAEPAPPDAEPDDAPDADGEPAPPVSTWLGCAYAPAGVDPDDEDDFYEGDLSLEAPGGGSLYGAGHGLEAASEEAYDDEDEAAIDAPDAGQSDGPDRGAEPAASKAPEAPAEDAQPDADAPPWARLVREAALAGRLTPHSPPSAVAFLLGQEPSFDAHVADCVRRCGDAEAGVEEALREVFHLVVVAHLERMLNLPDAEEPPARLA